MFHDENCKQIFDTLQRNEQKLDSDEESISKLKACDLSVLRHATEAINNQVQRLLDKEVKQQEIIAVDEICEPDKEVVEETIQPKRKPKRAKKNEMHSE